jgi:lysophospholipase L1-like esterase
LLVGILLLAFVLAGVGVLLPELGVVWIVVASLVLLLVVIARVLELPGPLMIVCAVLGSLVIALFALVGVDWATAELKIGRLDPIPSLIVGGVIVFLAALVSLHPLWMRTAMPFASVAAGTLALVLMLAPIGVFWVKAQIKGDGSELARREAVSELDVVALSADASTKDAASGDLHGWRVHVWSGKVEGERVQWGAGGAPPAVPRPEADRVLLLLPPARPKPNEVSRWMALADRVETRMTPTYAALDTTDSDRLQRWRAALSRVGGRDGDALPLRVGGRPQSVTELALRAAVLAPTSDEDLALAVAHRPALFMDRRELYPRPLDIDQLLGSGRISMCEPDQKLRRRCSEVHGATDLRTGIEHLAFDSHELASVGTATTIYVNVTRTGNDARNAVYLDYWWYLPHNPAGSGGGAFCGAGFVIGGITCFDHQSDWEGVTVVLNGDRPAAPPIAVDYAQHDGVTRYTWRALQRLWDLGDRRRFGSHIDAEQRPLVFAARGTHASYPLSCDTDQCIPNPVPGLRDRSSFEENSHDGALPWSGNAGVACAPVCVTALPTHRGGSEPASWNGWGGVWGTANCVLGIVCTSSQPPHSPGAQSRYQRPWCVGKVFDLTGAGFVERSGGCPDGKPSADELTHGERLLALGDSFSSGEGGGDYDPSTNSDTNTCDRSPHAWPRLVAHLRRLTPLHSLACSGAVIDDVLTGRASKEPERRLSQVGRIQGDPDLITLTIGGNDTGFASVVRACVSFDCVAKYHKPNGDLIDQKIAAVARRLPEVYEAIRHAAPRARLLVVDYPKLFPTSGRKHPVENCSAGGQISVAEADYLNAKAEELDVAIIAVAKRLNIDVVDVSNAFAGGELRCTGSTYMNPLRVSEEAFSASFHPNATGYERLAHVVSERLAALDG